MTVNAVGAVAAINLALAAALVFLWDDDERFRWAEPEALPPSLEDVVAARTPEPVDVSRYRETVERPLFASTRKIAPRSDSGGEGQAAADALKDVRLLGTYGAKERGGIVIVSGGKVQRVPIGASIGDWKVVGQEGRGAVLARANGERRQLELVLNAVPPAATAAKAGGTEAARPPAAEPAGAADADRARTPRRAASVAPASGGSSDAREQMRRQRLEQINARRAQRGLPPLTQ